ncbi:MAG: N-acetylgalactosamine-6-sulfatase [Cyclobacteriaceae bacterium]|nr:MAG: N-acetylgalactosamine-6-sulfatase [Cyclobacteriaceae bacterium]
MRKVPYFILLVVCGGCPSVQNEHPQVTQATNIILLMGDDHGWEETAYNGHPFLKTPVLDEMAASGLRLDNFYAGASTCSPTRGSFITGRHPNRYGTFAPNWSIRPEEISVASILKEAGYRTGHFGKWHLGPVKAGSPTNPGSMGFDSWLSHDNFFEIDPTLSRDGGPPEQFTGESSEILIDETIQFIAKAQKQEQQFLAVVWFGSPHEPYSGLEQDLALYDNLPDSLKEHQVTLTSMETGEPVKRPLFDVLKERYAEITAMDRAIGKLRKYLKETGQSENTLLWYCGDNGIPSSGLFNSSLHGLKGHIYDGGVLVPGIIEWPAGIPTARSSELNSVTSDILPTLCELTGQPAPNRPLDGVSLMPLIKGQMTERPTPICFWNYDTGHEITKASIPYVDPELQVGTTPLVKIMDGKYIRSFRNFYHGQITEQDYTGAKAILDNRYKLVIHDQDQLVKELFDMKNDPAEARNVIAEHPEIAKKLETQLKRWQESVLNSLTGADYAAP